MLDSLVRVSRRVNENHFVSITSTRSATNQPNTWRPCTQSFALCTSNQAGTRERPWGRTSFTSVQSTVGLEGYNRPHRSVALPSSQLSPARFKPMLTRTAIQSHSPTFRYAAEALTLSPTHPSASQWPIYCSARLVAIASFLTISSTF